MAEAVLPTWASPSKDQILDCLYLAIDQCEAARTVGRGDGNYEVGIARAITWSIGTGPSPMTGLPTAADQLGAQAELLVALDTELHRSPQAAVIPDAAAQGAARTLAWLLGRTAEPPIPLPRRPVPTADQLYEEALAAEPHRRWLPEDRDAARISSVEEATAHAVLARRADLLRNP